MPTYEYACRDCGEHLEAVQSFSDEPLAVCPKCGGSLRKVFGAVGIVFKGSGFYKTDNRSNGSRSSSTASSTGESTPAAESTSTTAASETKKEAATAAVSTATPSTTSAPASSS